MVIDYYYNKPHYNFLKNHNPDEIHRGDVLYFIQSNSDIWFGVVSAIFHDGCELELYMPDAKKMAEVDGIEYTYEKAPSHTKPIKLPKKQSERNLILNGSCQPKIWYNSDNIYMPDIQSKENLIELIKTKNLIPNKKIDWSYYDMICLEKDEIQYVKRAYSDSIKHSAHYENFIFIPWGRLFFDYNEAKQNKEDYEAELDRCAQLTDEEWAKEECANTLVKFINYCVRVQDVDVASQIHKKIMEQIEKFLQKKNLDWYDVKFRWISGGLEYKKCKNSKWTALAPAIDDELHEGLVEFLGQFD